MEIILDCGSHCGCSARKFRHCYPHADIHCFEPNPTLAHYYANLNATFHPVAVYTEDTKQPFYLSTTVRREGSSLIWQKCLDAPPPYRRPVLDKEHPCTVKCICLSRWIQEHCSKHDTVHLKLNCEGAEYAILQQLLDDGTIEWISHLYVDWHWHKIGLLKRVHSTIVRRLQSSGLPPQSWNGMERPYCLLL
jgi:FkbM family methyltransferase